MSSAERGFGGVSRIRGDLLQTCRRDVEIKCETVIQPKRMRAKCVRNEKRLQVQIPSVEVENSAFFVYATHFSWSNEIIIITSI